MKIETLLGALGSSDLERREEASAYMRQHPDPRWLEALLEGGVLVEGIGLSGRAEREVLRYIAGLGADAVDATGALLDLLQHRRGRVLKDIEAALLAIGAPAAPQIHAFLSRGEEQLWSGDGALVLALQALLKLPGEEVDASLLELLQRHPMFEGELGFEQESCLKLLRALGTRKIHGALPLLEELLERYRTVDLKEGSLEGREQLCQQIAYTCVDVIGEMGLAASSSVPLLGLCLAEGKLGLQRKVLEALGKIGSEEAVELLLPFLLPDERPSRNSPQDSHVHRGKLQQSAARSLQSLASPEAADRLVSMFLRQEVFEHAWRDVAKALAISVVQGPERFAWVRSLLAESEAGERLWHLLCHLTNHWPDDERSMLMAYLEGHLDAWPMELRELRIVPAYYRVPSELWWPNPPKGPRTPAWSLVRRLELHMDIHSGSAHEPFFRILGSPEAGHIVSLRLQGVLLNRERLGYIGEQDSLASLQELELSACACDFECWVQLSLLPCFSRLRSLTIEHGRNDGWQDPPFQDTLKQLRSQLHKDARFVCDALEVEPIAAAP